MGGVHLSALRVLGEKFLRTIGARPISVLDWLMYGNYLPYIF